MYSFLAKCCEIQIVDRSTNIFEMVQKVESDSKS